MAIRTSVAAIPMGMTAVVPLWVTVVVPFWMTAIIRYYTGSIPRPVSMPVIRVRPYPVYINQGSFWPIVRTPVIVVVGVPIGRPPVPIVAIVVVNDLNSRWFLLEILDENMLNIKGIPARGHDMHFNSAIFHMPSSWNINSLRGSIISKDEGIATERSSVI
jgi:hypothetical protein